MSYTRLKCIHFKMVLFDKDGVKYQVNRNELLIDGTLTQAGLEKKFPEYTDVLSLPESTESRKKGE
tara:strand:+ start:2762 stop:2959 length:198 start_codon:yes stop_codon:yes gene_type:complete